ncbi:MAG TPA: glycosyltransferase family 4 protein [Candidatus Saccharimonadales bacterium]|nr:glycosyltransferase family 4 protein [Candidatus Saccharimonadales bacterium]
MKILMLNAGSYKSGLNLRALALIPHLKRAGHDITLICPSADKYNNFTPEKGAQIDNAKLVQPWQPRSRSMLVNLLPYMFTSLVAMFRARPDAIYLFKPTPITIMGLLPRLLFRTTVVIDLDDFGSAVMRRENQPKWLCDIVEWCEDLTIRYCDAAVVVSRYLEQRIKARYPGKRVVVVPNGVAPDLYPVPKDQTLRHNIYYFGAMQRLNLVDGLLRAMPGVLRAVPDAKLTLVGYGDAIPDGQKLAKKLGVERAVTFTGKTDFLGIIKYTQFGDIGVCYQPDVETVRAASNMKVFQYMAMSTVAVVSDVGDLADYVQHGKLGAVVPPDDVPALEKTLIDLLHDDKRRARIAKAGRKLAETTYSWQTRVAVINDVFTDLVPGAKGARR